MPYRDLLRLEGVCSIVLGVVFAIAAFPGLLVSYRAPLAALLLVPATLAFLAVVGVRAGARASRPGEWLTTRPLTGADPAARALPAEPLRRRLVIETAAWIVVLVVSLVVLRSSGWLFFGTGLASIAFGLVQAVWARGHVRDVEARRGERFAVARRAGFGTPGLTTR